MFTLRGSDADRRWPRVYSYEPDGVLAKLWSASRSRICDPLLCYENTFMHMLGIGPSLITILLQGLASCL